jgi:hypothetical protein
MEVRKATGRACCHFHVACDTVAIAAGRKFGVTEGNIHRWRQRKDKLKMQTSPEKRSADL